MISAVDLLEGNCSGSRNGLQDRGRSKRRAHTNYEGKARAAVKALTEEGYDFAYIHVEAPDEMGHQGSVERKIQSIEYLDHRLIRLVKEGLDAAGEDYRMLILPDHPTPVKVRTHVQSRYRIFFMTAQLPGATTGIIMKRKHWKAESK